MKQWEAVNKIAHALKDDPAIRALFLKGSLARDDNDEFSDVDLYCLVHDDAMDDFLKRRITYLQMYKHILYWSESNFVGPQIVAVFEDGLHFDLYCITKKSLKYTDTIKILYDPSGLLSHYQTTPLSIGSEDLVTLINEFLFVLYEYQNAYKRKDFLWASRLASHMSGDLSIMIRSVIEPTQGVLGFKKLEMKLNNRWKEMFYRVMDQLGPSISHRGVSVLLTLFDEVLSKMTNEIISNVNNEFYQFLKNEFNEKIISLSNHTSIEGV